jgi:hypothetical protein
MTWFSKRCSGCKKRKPLWRFGVNTRDWVVQSNCWNCCYKGSMRWIRKNRAHVNQRAKFYMRRYRGSKLPHYA